MPERLVLLTIHGASRSVARITASLAVARLFVPSPPMTEAVRAGVPSGGTKLPEIMARIDMAAGELIKTHRAAGYGDLKVAGCVACAS